MRTFLLVIMALLMSTMSYAQTIYPDFWDGVVYFKFKNEAQIKLPAFSAGMNPADVYPENSKFIDLCKSYDIQEIVCPFKTKNENVQNIYRVKFSNYTMVDEFTRILSEMPEVEYAEKSPVLRIFSTPDDPDTTQQYYLSKINAYNAWDLSTGSPDIKIAIVDDAVRLTHPDLAANIWINPIEIPGNSIDDDGNGYVDDVSGWDAADNDNDPNAPTSPPAIWGELAFTHGTHCSGLAAGVTNNGIGIASISHNVSLIPIKAVSNSSWFPLGIEAPSEGVDYAIAAGAHIVSMSFGGEQASGFATLETLINTGHDQGIIFVAAAGNNGDGGGGIGTPNAVNYPAGFTNVLAVGATNNADVKPGFSQYGDWIDVMAPGVGIYSTLAWSSPYGNQDGTSMACPIVAGAIGLLKSYMPFASKEQIIFCLKQGCDNIDAINPTFIGDMGAGRINVYNSMVCLQQYQSIQIIENEWVTIFPNPASNTLFIGFNNQEMKQISIININGSMVMNHNAQDMVIALDISSLPSGMYVCRIEQNGKISTHRFVTQ